MKVYSSGLRDHPISIILTPSRVESPFQGLLTTVRVAAMMPASLTCRRCHATLERGLLTGAVIVRIGLISDTHIANSREELYPQVYQAFAGVDLILHAGDIYILPVLDRLAAIAPVLAARGNGDWALPEDPRLKHAHVAQLDGLRIGLTHDLLLPEMPPQFTLERFVERRFGGAVDVIVFGDTHVAQLEVMKGMLLVNPGSATLPSNYQKRLGTVGILEIVDGRPRAWLIPLNDEARRFLPSQTDAP